MRLTHISPEFNYSKVNGTLSMNEKKSFNASKMIKYDDVVYIQNQNIIYYQNTDGEQINFNSEKLLEPIIYNADEDKRNNSTLTINESQSKLQLDNNTFWDLTINYEELLLNYLTAKLKSFRTFEGVSNSMTINNDVDDAIKTYIKTNLFSRYEFKKIELFISYNDIDTGLLKFKNNWNPNIQSQENILSKMDIRNDIIDKKLYIKFNQEKTSLKYSFDYYFNLNFEKI